MAKTRIGIIGIGGMGSNHFETLRRGQVAHAEVTAVCDLDPERLAWARAEGIAAAACFDNADAFLAAAPVDAVMVCTPHYDHPPQAIGALKRGWHVLIEKPAGVHTRQVRELNAVAAEAPGVFAVMFNQRTLASHRKIKDLIDAGELGEIRRVNWIITAWFRTQAYYDSGGWRATWKGEGGGVLVNQCPHQLDLLQWFCGLPTHVRAFCAFGKYHDIEVEDDVTAYLAYANGATGVFVTGTGEAPGTNRLEIAGDRGLLVLEDGDLRFRRNRVPMDTFRRTSGERFAVPEVWDIRIPAPESGPAQHAKVIQNWVNAIRDGEPLQCPGVEGMAGVELANAMLMSTWTDRTVTLPIDDDAYLALLEQRIRASKPRARKTNAAAAGGDLAASFGAP